MTFLSDRKVAVGSSKVLGLTEHSFTVEAWVRVREWTGRDQTIVGCGNNVRDIIAKSRTLFVGFRPGGLPHIGLYHNDLTSPDPVPLNTWVHLAFRYHEHRRELAIFVNGSVVAVGGDHDPLIGDSELHLNRWQGMCT